MDDFDLRFIAYLAMLDMEKQEKLEESIDNIIERSQESTVLNTFCE